MNLAPRLLERGSKRGLESDRKGVFRARFTPRDKLFLILPGKGPDSQSIPSAYKVQKHIKEFEVHGRQG